MKFAEVGLMIASTSSQHADQGNYKKVSTTSAHQKLVLTDAEDNGDESFKATVEKIVGQRNKVLISFPPDTSYEDVSLNHHVDIVG